MNILEMQVMAPPGSHLAACFGGERLREAEMADGLRAAKCPWCGAPAKSAKPPAGNAVPLQAAATPEERGAGKLAPAKPTVPKPSPANLTRKKVSN